MHGKTLLFLTMTAVLATVSSLSAGSLLTIRPYARLGTLLNKPSAKDLEYVGENMDQYLDVTGTNYGVGAQLLLGTGIPTVNLGLDLGFQKLFNSRLDTEASDLGPVYEDYHDDSEWDGYLLLAGEFSPPMIPLFFQAGMGPHFVYWDWEYFHSGSAGAADDWDSGLEVNFGLMLTAGANLKIAPTLSVPIMLRVDYLMRYEGMAAMGLAAGISLSI